ncbi:glycosyltransferase [Sphingomonas sp. GC_Shp_3]|uniref:glycosyltransferase n=1 Tax=Sphingomonas sp. GC_Shp_3 TaxID=2937383 RepID=UPI002269D82F|nr:glycosyltransferase [Sphingomonas sp. GC_Shp_3]
MKFPFGGKKTHRHIGDAHRATADWALAAAAYRRHLDENPYEHAIWVQLGHAEKEQGNFAGAEAAYGRAVEIATHDPDPRLHLAHLLKTQARFDDAAEAFLSLYQIDPSRDNLAELNRMISLRRRRYERVAAAGAVLFSMQDIFNMFAVHTTATGIQRVQVGVALAAMDDPSFDAHFIINGEYQNEVPTFLRLEDSDLRDIIAYASGKVIDHDVLKRMLTVARFRAVPITFGAGTTVVILGAFWGIGNGIDQYLYPRRQGARIIPFIHDIIPITHPQYCDANLTNFFWRGLAELLHAADYALTNSDFTQLELKRFVAEQGSRQIPMQTVPLAHSMGRKDGSDTVWPRALAKLKGRRYVAYVSTIEGRKNHFFVVQAWQKMIALGIDVPDLVFVGREGWKVEQLMMLLAQTNNLDGRIHMVHGLSDAELNGVYADAMFTLFTSVVEGWGLPVGESLAHGVPCVVTKTASLPEVGGNFADYIELDDQESAILVLRKLIEDGPYREARRRNIRENFVPRTWDDVGRDFVAKLRGILATALPPRVLPPVTLPEGTVFRPGEITERVEPLPGYLANPLGLALIESFYEPEPWGAWMRGATGQFVFLTQAEAGTEIVVFVSMRAAPWAIGAHCALKLNGQGKHLGMVLTPGPNFARLKGRVDRNGSCTISFHYDGGVREPADMEPDKRRFALGLNAIGYAWSDDTVARSELREEFVFS